MIGIYKITNKINQKIYIGKSINIIRRFGDHKRITSNRLLKKDFLKYGIQNFSFDILEECSIRSLNKRERFYISQFKSYDRQLGYNLSLGGDGFNPSLEARSYLSKKQKGSGNSFYGRTHSESALEKIRNHTIKMNKERVWKTSTKRKISKSLKKYFSENGYPESAREKKREYNRKYGNPNQKFQFTLINPQQEQIIFNNLMLFCKENNLAISSISQLCSGHTKSNQHKGWTFVKKERVK